MVGMLSVATARQATCQPGSVQGGGRSAAQGWAGSTGVHVAIVSLILGTDQLTPACPPPLQTDINLPFITADATGAKHLQMTLTR